MTKQRDRALDLLRTLAVLRVFLWHATGWPLLTWVGALPVMFYVTGYLFSTGSERHGVARTLGDRARRLLIPYWFFAAVMLAVMWTVSGRTWPGRPSELLGWLLPVVDPVGAPWQQGWITEPLWYLRTYTWLLLLAAPLLWLLSRRPLLVLAGLSGGVFAGELLLGVRHWPLQDVLLYGLFFAAGAGTGRGLLRPRRRDLLITAGTAVALVAAWTSFRPPLDGVVNNSHTAHMLVGTVWLALAVAFLPVLRRVAAHARVGRAVEIVTSRSLSIYLWHAPALGLGYLALARTPLEGTALTVTGVLLGAILTAVVTSAVVGVERHGGRRRADRTSLPARLLPSARTGALTAAAAGLVMGTLVAVPPRAVSLPPTPSKAPEQVDLTENEALAFLLEPSDPGAGNVFTATPATPEDSFFTSDPYPSNTDGIPVRRGGRTRSPITAPTSPGTPTTEPVAVPSGPRETRPVADWDDIAPLIDDAVRDAVVAAAGDWVRRVKADKGITYETGLEIAIVQPGRLRYATTIDKNGEAAPVGDSIPFASITKSFTAALLLRAVEDGRIGMDDPIGRLDAAPWFTLTDGLTLRNLLAHRSGIVNYASTRTWNRDWQVIDGWEPVLRAADDEGRAFPVGSKVEYSSTNYVIAGLLAAQIYRTPIEKLIQEQLLEPLGLRRTRVGQPVPGAPGTGTGNMSGHVTDLARWGVAMWRDKTVLGPTGNALASYTDPVQLIGYGGFSYCPCRSERGKLVVAGIGANGAEATVRWYPGTDTVIALRVPNGLIPELEELINDLLIITR